MSVWSRSRDHRYRRAALSLATIALSAFGGTSCELVYDQSYRSDGFVIYSDRDREFVSSVGRDVEHIVNAYFDVFALSRDDYDHLTIVLEGADSDVLDYRYSPDVLGYYVPLLDYVCIDTNPVWPELDRVLGQILLHEIAHHFIAMVHPEAGRSCWLNEGLAGTLEVTLFDERHFEYPLFHPVLFQVASRAAFANESPLRVRELVEKRWSEFHASDAKERNYALSWSLVYYVLTHHFSPERPLDERIRHLLRLSHDELVELEAGWNVFLRGFDRTGHLLELARSAAPELRLTGAWALRELGSPRGRDDRRILRGLRALFDDPRRERRHAAYTAFLRRLESTPFSFVFGEPWIQEALRELRGRVLDAREPEEFRIEVVGLVGESVVYRSQWIPLLIDLLESQSGRLRRAAAESLVSLTGKPTITNPAFWESGGQRERGTEVEDWQKWWTGDLAH